MSYCLISWLGDRDTKQAVLDLNKQLRGKVTKKKTNTTKYDQALW